MNMRACGHLLLATVKIKHIQCRSYTTSFHSLNLEQPHSPRCCHMCVYIHTHTYIHAPCPARFTTWAASPRSARCTEAPAPRHCWTPSMVPKTSTKGEQETSVAESQLTNFLRRSTSHIHIHHGISQSKEVCCPVALPHFDDMRHSLRDSDFFTQGFVFA
jgi:hypothetical protein